MYLLKYILSQAKKKVMSVRQSMYFKVIYVLTYMYIFQNMYMLTHIYVYMYSHICTCMNIYIRRYAFTYMHSHANKNTHKQVYVLESEVAMLLHKNGCTELEQVPVLILGSQKSTKAAKLMGKWTQVCRLPTN